MAATFYAVIYDRTTNKVSRLVRPDSEQQFIDSRCVNEGEGVLRLPIAGFPDNLAPALALLGLTP